jgi:hypothetical protein
VDLDEGDRDLTITCTDTADRQDSAVRTVTKTAASGKVIYSLSFNCGEHQQGDEDWNSDTMSCPAEINEAHPSLPGVPVKIARQNDGISANGNREQITEGANYPGGAGGGGQRHWICNSGAKFLRGNNGPCGSGGLFHRLTPFPPATYYTGEINIRFYVKFDAGLKLGGNRGKPLFARAHKLIYFTNGWCGPSGNNCYIDVQGTHFAFVVNGNSYACGGSFPRTRKGGWDGLMGGAADAAADGRWKIIEIYIKADSGSGDAEFKLKAGNADDPTGGRQLCHLRNLWGNQPTGFAGFAFAHNHQFRTLKGDPEDQAEDLDDLAVMVDGGGQWIGPFDAMRGY